VIAVRAVMGLGAAIIMPIVLAVLTVLYTEQERGRAISFVVIAIGAGLLLGSIVGGYLLEHFWWGSIFLINVRVGRRADGRESRVLLPEPRDPHSAGADLPGASCPWSGWSASSAASSRHPDAAGTTRSSAPPSPPRWCC